MSTNVKTNINKPIDAINKPLRRVSFLALFSPRVCQFSMKLKMLKNSGAGPKMLQPTVVVVMSPSLLVVFTCNTRVRPAGHMGAREKTNLT